MIQRQFLVFYVCVILLFAMAEGKKISSTQKLSEVSAAAQAITVSRSEDKQYPWNEVDASSFT